MDPQKAFDEFILACDRNHHEEAVELGDCLLDWLNRQGHQPKVSAFAFRCMVFQLAKTHAEAIDVTQP